MKQVGVLATVQSFDDCFYLATMISLCGLIPCLWLKRGKKVRSATAAMRSSWTNTASASAWRYASS